MWDKISYNLAFLADVVISVSDIIDIKTILKRRKLYLPNRNGSTCLSPGFQDCYIVLGFGKILFNPFVLIGLMSSMTALLNIRILWTSVLIIAVLFLWAHGTFLARRFLSSRRVCKVAGGLIAHVTTPGFDAVYFREPRRRRRRCGVAAISRPRPPPPSNTILSSALFI